MPAAPPTGELVYLTSGEIELADPADDVRGLPVHDLNGLRLGEVEDLVVDVTHRRVRMISVVSGGLLGLSASRRLMPMAATRRVRAGLQALGRDHASPVASEPDSVASLPGGLRT